MLAVENTEKSSSRYFNDKSSCIIQYFATILKSFFLLASSKSNSTLTRTIPNNVLMHKYYILVL